MEALLWIAGIVVVYFFLKMFDTKKSNKEETRVCSTSATTMTSTKLSFTPMPT